MIDGDDWLPHDRVLQRINQEYQNPDVWLTYGQYEENNGTEGFCQQIPQRMIRERLYRKFKWVYSHVRTFYAALFKKIKKEDVMYEGDFFRSAYDMAFMFPMLEMASEHIRFIPDILYIYNVDNPLADNKVDRPLQARCDGEIRRRDLYEPLSTLFTHD